MTLYNFEQQLHLRAPALAAAAIWRNAPPAT